MAKRRKTTRKPARKTVPRERGAMMSKKKSTRPPWSDPVVTGFPVRCELSADEARALLERGVPITMSAPREFLEEHLDAAGGWERAERLGITVERIEAGDLSAAELLLLVEGLPAECIPRDGEALPLLREHIDRWANPPEDDEDEDDEDEDEG